MFDPKPQAHDAVFAVCQPESKQAADPEAGVETLQSWERLHQLVATMPGNSREVFQLIWYRGLSKNDVAKLIGVDLRTVQRHWRQAREYLVAHVGDDRALMD